MTFVLIWLVAIMFVMIALYGNASSTPDSMVRQDNDYGEKHRSS